MPKGGTLQQPGSLAHSVRLDGMEGTVRTAIDRVRAQGLIERIWARDYTVWSSAPAEIVDRLGWLDIATRMRGQVAQIAALANACRKEGYTQALLLGMGGSSLAPEVFRKAFDVSQGYLDLAILDSTAPEAVLAWHERLDLSQTLFLVSTKSGTTVETLSLFEFFYREVARSLGSDHAGPHFVAITDPGSKLVAIAEEHRFRATILGDPNIGGRYSALSPFGLVPAALVGVDLAQLLDRADEAAEMCGPGRTGEENPGLWLGAALGALAMHGRDKLTLVSSPQIASFESWIEQLVAESTGKDGRGILPVVGEALGSADRYGDDRVFVHLEIADDTEVRQRLDELAALGHPVIRLRLRDVYDLGQQISLWEMATAVASHLLGVHPFDQPDVEAAKVRARAMLKSFAATGRLPQLDDAPVLPAQLPALLAARQSGDYVSLQAFLSPSDDHAWAIETLRLAIRDRFCLATTWGYGPRFLHSTGQLHKGGPNRGLFIQVTAEDQADTAIGDDQQHDGKVVTFGVLKDAQARGDRQALMDAGRRVIHFDLGRDPVARLTELAETVTTG